ncbi:MAG: hypothetical protein JXA14_15785 [Anaerolineae bacterium]|nr:hypothetical protein [Anaerolineae bacterium]
MTEKRRECWWDLLALGGYALIALAYAWPLVRSFGMALAGDGYDRYVFLWANWWVTHAISQGKPLYQTAMIFYPQGANLHFLSFSWLNTFVWWVLRPFAGNVAAYNFTVWWSWPVAGFGTYLLAREVTNDRRAAFVAGLIYAFYPYHFAQRNHLNLLSVQWTPFALLFLTRATRRGRAVDGLLAGLFFACAGLSSWHQLTLTGLLGGFWLLYAWLTERSEWVRGNWRALVVMGVTVAALVSPLLAPLVWEQFVNPEGQDPYLGKEEETQTDLVAYILPNLYHPLWGRVAAPVHQRFLRNKDHSVALGYVPLALVGYGLLRWRGSKQVRFWLVALLAFILLAIGPFPRINGVAYPQVVLPYRLVGWTFPVSSLRNPERFNIAVGLCLALVAGVAVSDLLHRLSARRMAAIIAIVLGVLVLLEYWSWPFPTRPPDVPEFYHQLALETGDFAIVDLPITNDLSKRYMYYQTVHGKATVTGHVSRPPQGAYDFIEGNGLLRAMWQDQRPDPAGDPAAEMAALADAGVRYVIVHKEYLNGEELAVLSAYMPGAFVFADDELVVYRTAP